MTITVETELGELEVKTSDIPRYGLALFIGGALVDASDFNELVKYYISNTDLNQEGNDPRHELVQWFKRLHQVDGCNPGRSRLEPLA